MTEQTGRQPFRFRFPFWQNPASSTTQPPLQTTTTSQSQRPQSRPPLPFTNLLSSTTRQTGQVVSSPSRTSRSQPQASQSMSLPRGTSEVLPTTQTRPLTPTTSVHSTKTPSKPLSPPQPSRQNIPPKASPPSPSQAATTATQSIASQRSPSPLQVRSSQSHSASLTNPEHQQPTTKFHSETLPSPFLPKKVSESQPATVVPQELLPASISTKPSASPEKPSIPQASNQARPQRTPKSPDKTSAKSSSKLSQVTNQKIHEASLQSTSAAATTLKADNATIPINRLIQTQRSELQLQRNDEKKTITKQEANPLGKSKTPEDEEPKKKEETFVDKVPMSIDQHQIHFGSVPVPTKDRETTRPNKVEKHRDLSEKKSAAMTYEGEESKLLTSTKQNTSHTTDTDRHPSSSTTNSERTNLEKEIRQDISRYIHQATARNHQPEDNFAVNVTTLAGDNKGAHMNIRSKAINTEGLVHIHRGYKIQKEDKVDMTKNEDETANEQPNIPRNQMSDTKETYANSNSQSINNSILYNSSCSEKSPGIHLTLSYGPLTAVNKSKERKDLFKTLKANSIMKPNPQLASQTNIRRRCLRSLFMESSESDPDNQQKPRRHGCRYRCGEI
ncbi:uncharacterized protein [Aristolochia californica]|uniref:uncharacterized protein n=1 Tax=Aristolochia californica TaxID=171875 RepID=UPI0035DDD48B